MADGEYELVGVETLAEYPGNPRIGDVEAIRESIRANGLVGALTVQRSTRHVLSGNHTLRAAIAEGYAEVPVVWEDVDDGEARRIVLAFNRASDLGYYDDEALLDSLAALDDFDGSLYTPDEYEALSEDPPERQPSGTASNAMSASERRDGYDANPVRSLIFPLSPTEYEPTLARITELRRAWHLDTAAEVVIRALDDAAGRAAH